MNNIDDMETPTGQGSTLKDPLLLPATIQFRRYDLSRLIAGESCMSICGTASHCGTLSVIAHYEGWKEKEGGEEADARSPQMMPSGLKSVRSLVDAQQARIEPYL